MIDKARPFTTDELEEIRLSYLSNVYPDEIARRHDRTPGQVIALCEVEPVEMPA